MIATEYKTISPDILAEFREKGDEPEFWADRWRDTDYLQFLRRYEDGYLGEFRRVFTKHLPKDSQIIEAGCGRGQYVFALRQLGYDAIGVDFARDLVEAIRRAKPDMPVEVGDVRSLNIPDGTLGAYISLGVVEHFWDGTDAILREAHRVLDRGGLALVSVPHFSPGFQKWARKRVAEFSDSAAPDGRSFYQFYFSKDEFRRRLEKAGFEPIETFYYAAKYSAKRAYPRFNKLYDSSYALRVLFNYMFKITLPQKIQSQFAHMMMVVARKV